MSLTKADISALTIDDKLKTDLLSLFGDIETKELELVSLRAKVPTNSQRIVDNVDADKFAAATEELAQLKQQMATKLNEEGSKESGAVLSAFAQFFE